MLFAGLITLAFGCFGYADEGLLLGNVHPYDLKNDSGKKQVPQKTEDKEVKQKEEEKQVEIPQPKKVEAKQEKPKQEIKPESKPQPEKPEKIKNIAPKGLKTARKTQESVSPWSKGKQIPELDKITTVVEIQRAIALQNAKKQLAQIEQDILKINVEKEKLKQEIKKLKNPAEKTQTTDKPVYVKSVGGLSGIPEGMPKISAVMISSVDGMRALVRDGVTTYYVHKGDKVSTGTVSEITGQGVLVDQEDGQVLYPIMH